MSFIDDRLPSIRGKFDEFIGKKNIEERCTEESLEKLREAFKAADNERMNEIQFQKAFQNTLKIYLEPEELQILFKKINSNRNGFVTWDEFVSYVLVEFQERDVGLQWQTLEPPLTGLPITTRTHHRSPIIRILFCPEVLPDRTSSFLRGCYLTASKDGMINYWSLDLVYERSVQSTNPFLRVRPTFITDCIAMPDVQIVCTSSTERDLRFYDCVAKKFDLRVMISSLECAVVCMSYHFSVDVEEQSYIILGDTSGSIIVMSFSSIEKGPFRHMTERDLTHHRYENVVEGALKGLRIVEFKNVHDNWVSQVAYFHTLRAFVSCAKSTKCSLLVSDPTGTKMRYKFDVTNGISCFNFCEENQSLITGGPDCIVRIWNPFVPDKPSLILRGHHASICAIVVQNFGKRLYTVAKDRCIKVWDVGSQTCIQTYNNLPSELGEHTELSTMYNDVTHKMIIASMMIAVIVCERLIDEKATDGFTHSQPVSCVLYNSLFKVIVTTGLDSCIIVWDPWLGRRYSLTTNAHSQLSFGKRIGMEITAACFDSSEQLLLTGASDGSLKMWNFNTGSCIRNMSIEDNCEVTSLIWLKNRILCTGWNRRITEFADTPNGIHKKNWETRHTEDVLCAAVRNPEALATASYNGEMVLWRLETGQPYRRYQVSDPTRSYTIVYKKDTRDKQSSNRLGKSNKKIGGKSVKIKNTKTSSLYNILRNENLPIDESAIAATRTVPARSIIFLAKRQLAPNIGSLLVSLESGLIQVWTHHTAAGFLNAFTVIHKRGDCALSMATDAENEFLITGHAAGYIKVWLLKNYALANPPKVSMPQLRLEFPFLWKDRINGGAKRAVRDQSLPILLSSLRGHTKAVNSLEYISAARMIISASADNSVRLWTLSGRYISTLGTLKPWSTILPDTPVNNYFTNYRIPPDVKRIASFTTLKVLRGGQAERTKGKIVDVDATIEVLESERKLLYGERLDIPLLGEYYDVPSGAKNREEKPIVDSSLAYIPVYSHLTTHVLETIEAPLMPDILRKQGTTRTLVMAISKLRGAASKFRKAKSHEVDLAKNSTVDNVPSIREDRTIL